MGNAENMRDEDLTRICEICHEKSVIAADKVIAERDELKAEIQLVREQTAKAARIMIEEAERVVARRAVEICEEREKYADKRWMWGYSEGSAACADALRAEFNIDQAQDSSPVGSETGEKHAQTAGNDK